MNNFPCDDPPGYSPGDDYYDSQVNTPGQNSASLRLLPASSEYDNFSPDSPSPSLPSPAPLLEYPSHNLSPTSPAPARSSSSVRRHPPNPFNTIPLSHPHNISSPTKLMTSTPYKRRGPLGEKVDKALTELLEKAESSIANDRTHIPVTKRVVRPVFSAETLPNASIIESSEMSSSSAYPSYAQPAHHRHLDPPHNNPGIRHPPSNSELALTPFNEPASSDPQTSLDQPSYHPSTSPIPGQSGSSYNWPVTHPSQGNWIRPSPSIISYERKDINGSPRPGTPGSSRYSSNPKRPLPPAPLFAANHRTDLSEDNDDGNGSSCAGTVPVPTVVSVCEYPTSNDSDDPFKPSDYHSTNQNPLNSRSSITSETSETNSKASFEHYAPAPTGAQARRGARQAQMAKKEVRLINGELILECKIPTILYSFLPRRDDNEFTHMRYTAVTCDPDEFVDRGYKLRQNIGSTMRETELAICITMYNEDEIHFTRTMHGVMRNIAHFCSRTKSRTWGKDGWQKIVVCIIADGRTKIHPRTLDALAAMGVYQEGIAKNQVNQKQVTAHVYEYTTQVSLDADLKFKGAEKGIVPCQMVFCMKEQNLKKLNSHRWFFNAFGQLLKPNVCILLDVGTRPEPTALYHLWKAFDLDSNVAGAAGEIFAGKGKGWLGLLNPLVAAQNFEYKMSNILDKPMESVFGYITVLPGALSAYRFHALQNDETGYGPLSQYFKGETLHGQNADVFTANMYLAEDRILCWELVAKRNERWLLKYVSSAKGETDVPDTVPEFISQRRRWLNGAFFAAVYSLLHFKQIWKTDHSVWRKILLHIEFLYQFVSLIFTYFSLTNLYLTFYFVAGSLSDPKVDPFGHSIGKVIFVILRYSCVLLICMQFILSMGNRPQGAKRMFFVSMVAYSVMMAYTTFAAMYMVVWQLRTLNAPLNLGNNVFTNIVISSASTVGLYFVMSFLYLEPWHMFTSSAQYFALLPSYICTLQVYAFCNAHDVTWGTKGDNILQTDLGAARGTSKNNIVELEMPSEQLDIDSGYDEALRNLRDRLEVPVPAVSEVQAQEDYYRAVRTYMVMAWLFANATVTMAISEAYSDRHMGENLYLTFLLWCVAAIALFRAIGSSAFGIINIVHSIAEGRMKWSRSWTSSAPSHSRWSSGKQSFIHFNWAKPSWLTGPKISSGGMGSRQRGRWFGTKFSNINSYGKA